MPASMVCAENGRFMIAAALSPPSIIALSRWVPLPTGLSW